MNNELLSSFEWDSNSYFDKQQERIKENREWADFKFIPPAAGTFTICSGCPIFNRDRDSCGLNCDVDEKQISEGCWNFVSPNCSLRGIEFVRKNEDDHTECGTIRPAQITFDGNGNYTIHREGKLLESFPE